MHLEIITPDLKVFKGEVTGVKVPGVNGSFEILNNHAPVVSALGLGEVRITSKEGVKNIKIDGGILEMKNNQIILLAESVLS